MAYSSKTHIVCGQRQFTSAVALVSSSPRMDEIDGDGTAISPWWADITVLFPDKGVFSCAMVEVCGKVVRVGDPVRSKSFCALTYGGALEVAEKVNNSWLQRDVAADVFVDELNFSAYT